VTKTKGDKYRIYSLIIILNVRIVANVRCGFFRISNMSHLTMLLLGNEKQRLSFFGMLQAPLRFLPNGLF